MFYWTDFPAGQKSLPVNYNKQVIIKNINVVVNTK